MHMGDGLFAQVRVHFSWYYFYYMVFFCIAWYALSQRKEPGEPYTSP